MPQEEKRVKDFPRAVGGVQTDDYIPVDGTTKGTRKITVDDIIEAAVSGLDTDANTVKAAINELKANAFGTIALTKAEYDALPASKLTDGIAYYIYDTDPDVDNAVWTKVGRETLTIGSSCSDGINQLKQSLSDLGDATLLHTFTAVDSTGVTIDFTPYRTALVVVYDGTWGYMASSYYPMEIFLTANNHWARSQWGNSVVSGAVRFVSGKLQCLYLENGGLSAVECRVYGLK